jgi:hypothetical protein
MRNPNQRDLLQGAISTLLALLACLAFGLWISEAHANPPDVAYFTIGNWDCVCVCRSRRVGPDLAVTWCETSCYPRSLFADGWEQ